MYIKDYHRRVSGTDSGFWPL